MNDFPNAIIFDSPTELLLNLVGLGLLVVLLAWGAYRYGKYTRRDWRAVLSKLPIGVVLFDTTHQCTFVNSTARELLQKLDDTLLEQARQAAIRGQELSWTVRGPDNSLVQAQTWLHDDKSRLILTLRDFTKQQQQEANHRTFIQALSHELQTPLTAIQGHLTHIVSSNYGDESSWRGSLQVVREEIERLAWLTPNVLTLLRLDAGQTLNRQLHNLGVVAEQVVQQLWERAAQQGITLKVYTESGLVRILIDRSAWTQVFLNLIDNSLKYAGDGSTVTVTLRQTDDAQIITVADDGPGIAPADIPLLFKPLYRSEIHQHIKGSGLGLAIVHRVVELHGGQIICQSNREPGTTFKITLPLGNQNVT